jgi:hypothetical protein
VESEDLEQLKVRVVRGFSRSFLSLLCFQSESLMFLLFVLSVLCAGQFDALAPPGGPDYDGSQDWLPAPGGTQDGNVSGAQVCPASIVSAIAALNKLATARGDSRLSVPRPPTHTAFDAALEAFYGKWRGRNGRSACQGSILAVAEAARI